MKSLIFFVFLLITITPAMLKSEESPSDVIHQFNIKLLDVMKHGKQLGFTGRQTKLLPVIQSAYDMNAMTRNVLGLAAKQLSSEDLDKLSKIFTKFSVATYADQFSDWDGERFEIIDSHPQTNGMVLVLSKIIDNKGISNEIDYVMQNMSGQWKIVDVLFDGSISQVAVRRSEMIPIYRREGLDGLILVLEKKIREMEQK
jgi:phospholipid transport system substrate-binding protein